MQEVMIDCETLAVTADAVILSIGAVEFELDGRLGDTFYRSVSIDSNLALGRRVKESTLIWWFDQDRAAQEVFREAKHTLESALTDLSDWYYKTGIMGEDGKVSTCPWSNGASFDIPMLEHAYEQCGMETPWRFFNSRCMRTYRNLPGADKVPRPAPSVAHNALQDAIAQAKYVQDIHRALFERGEVMA